MRSRPSVVTIGVLAVLSGLAPGAGAGDSDATVRTYEGVLLADPPNPTLKKAPDPAVLFVTGIAQLDGTIVIRTLRDHPIGKVSVAVPGAADLTIDLLDSKGDIVSSIAGPVPFQMQVLRLRLDENEPSKGNLIDVDSAPIALSLPYPVNAAKLRLTWTDGRVPPLVVNPLSGTLRSTIAALPDRAFLSDDDDSKSDEDSSSDDGKSDDDSESGGRRTALLKQVDAFERALDAGKRKRALKRLGKIHDKASKWLVELDQADLETTKGELLELIDSLDTRVRAQM